jgi:hypothetical protein
MAISGSEKSLSRVKLVQTDLFKVGDFLRKHCAKVGIYAIYEPGWTDEKVAAEMRPGISHINVNHVANLRRNLIGCFPPAVTGSTALLGGMERVVARLSALEEWAESLAPNLPPHQRYAKLVFNNGRDEDNE